MLLAFHGLVLEAMLIYGYVYHRANFLARFSYLRGFSVGQPNPLRGGAEEVLPGTPGVRFVTSRWKR
jgi:hypothetical protein